jgi:uncharacterized damage-inducible protein DinB
VSEATPGVGDDFRVDPPLRADEVTTLRSFLDYHRDTLRLKCRGLTQEQLAQRLPPSDMSLGGLMKHLALVESQWFDYFLRDLPLAPPFDTADWDASPDWEFDSARQDNPEELRALFDEAVRRADSAIDEALAAGGIEHESVRKSRRVDSNFSLRWMLVHMIEEYARHNGHADLIRESIDGQKGE